MRITVQHTSDCFRNGYGRRSLRCCRGALPGSLWRDSCLVRSRDSVRFALRRLWQRYVARRAEVHLWVIAFEALRAEDHEDSAGSV